MTGYSMYPLNQSLAEEIQRLFNKWCTSFSSGDSGAEDDAMADFRSNGHRDCEYLPETDGAGGANRYRRKKLRKLIIECVFCKKNGAGLSEYMSHTLKAPDGKVVCPVLRAYKCPICGESGDNAHTLKYCPERQVPVDIFK